MRISTVIILVACLAWMNLSVIQATPTPNKPLRNLGRDLFQMPGVALAAVDAPPGGDAGGGDGGSTDSTSASSQQSVPTSTSSSSSSTQTSDTSSSSSSSSSPTSSSIPTTSSTSSSSTSDTTSSTSSTSSTESSTSSTTSPTSVIPVKSTSTPQRTPSTSHSVIPISGISDSLSTSTAIITATAGNPQNNNTQNADTGSTPPSNESIIIAVCVAVGALALIGTIAAVVWRTRRPRKMKPVVLNFDDDDLMPNTQMLVEDNRRISVPPPRFRRPLSTGFETPTTPTSFSHESASNPSTTSFLLSGRTTPVFDDGPTSAKNGSGGGWFKRVSPRQRPMSVGRATEEEEAMEMRASGDLGAQGIQKIHEVQDETKEGLYF